MTRHRGATVIAAARPWVAAAPPSVAAAPPSVAGTEADKRAESAEWYVSTAMRTATRIARAAAAAVHDTRGHLGWSQEELGRRADTSQSSASRIEAERAGDIALGTVFDVIDALGIQVSFELRPPLLAEGGRQRDLVHSRCLAACARRLRGLHWIVEHEVEIGRGPTRGWIDLLAYEQVARSLFIGEIKTDLPDVGGAERQVRWYEREARFAARRLGWEPVRTGVALIGLASAAFDARVTANREHLATTFPGRAADLATWLADPTRSPPPRTLALIDPASRRKRWLQATAADGGRTPFPYADYRDAAQRLTR